MAKTILIVISIILTLAIIIIAGVYFLTRFPRPDITHFKNIQVSEKEIVLNSLRFGESAVWYAGHTTVYDNGVLTITVYGRGPIRFPGDQYNGITVTIPNTYTDLAEIRLGGGRNEEDKIIWRKGN